MNDLKGKVSIVTGSSRGIGAATARKLAQKGCNVVINYSSSEDEAREIAAECEKLGAETLLCQADVADDDDCRRLVDAAVEKWGRIDSLVNNAGITRFCDHADLDGLSKDDFLNLYGVNVVGPYQMIRAAYPHLKETDGGAIVNVASIAGVTGVGSSVAYAASKGALITMTLSLARALGPEVRVNAVCPGFVQGKWLKKGLGEELYEAVRKMMEDAAPLHLTATAENVADAIYYFIASAGITTGETLLLDGGYHLNMALPGRR